MNYVTTKFNDNRQRMTLHNTNCNSGPPITDGEVETVINTKEKKAAVPSDF